MPRFNFKSNILEILLFAIIGTLMNAVCIGLCLYFAQYLGYLDYEIFNSSNWNVFIYLLFGAIISAVDPVAVIAVFNEINVNLNLYILVFGESLLNDGMAVVLYQIMQELNILWDASQGPGYLTTSNIMVAVGMFFYVAGGGVLIGFLFGLLTSYFTKFSKFTGVMEIALFTVMPYMSYMVAEMVSTSALLSVMTCGFILRTYSFED